MLRQGGFAIGLLLVAGAAGCAEPLDPGSVGDYRLRDAAGGETNNNTGFTPDEDTGSAPAADDSGAVAEEDTGSAAAEGGTPDTGTPDTGTPDTGTPDTGTPDTGTPDTAPPDTGTPPPVDSGTGAEITFPILTDTYVIKYDPNFWNLGDYIQGSRKTSLASITSISGTIGIVNSLSPCGTLDLVVSINGAKVGTVKIASTHGKSVPLSLTFPAATGPTYVIRYQAGNTVASGCGALSFNEDVTKLTLK